MSWLDDPEVRERFRRNEPPGDYSPRRVVMTQLRDGSGREILPPVLPDAEFKKRFGTEEACVDFLLQSRWPTGLECPWCHARGSFRRLDLKRFLCLACRKKTSVTAGTILHRTRKPLTAWFRAAFLVVQRGASARLLQASVGLTYKVAWCWVHKLHELMKLETRLPEPSPPCPPSRGKSAQARRQWESTHGGFAWEADRGREVASCCARLDKADWTEPSPPGALLVTARTLLFRAHSGSVSEKHLPSYLAETAFRVNHRALRPGEAAEVLLGRYARVGPHDYASIRGPRERRAPIVFWQLGPSRD